MNCKLFDAYRAFKPSWPAPSMVISALADSADADAAHLTALATTIIAQMTMDAIPRYWISNNEYTL